MAEHRGLSEQELIVAVRDGILPEGISIKDVCDEVRRLRRALRGQDRRAEQVRKLRWTGELLLTKIDELTKVEHLEKRIADDIATWIEGYEDEPLEPRIVADALREGKWR